MVDKFSRATREFSFHGKKKRNHERDEKEEKCNEWRQKELFGRKR